MFDDTPRAAWIQRCTHTEIRGGRNWQCTLADPHPDVGHDFGPDAEYGRVLHEQRPDWLAGQLRDKTALVHHLQRRVDELQAHAVRLAVALALGDPFHPPAETKAWAARNAPHATELLGWDR